MQQTALITGASQGIGASIASELAKNNIHTILLARNSSNLKEVADSIHAAGGSCSYYSCDVTRPGEISATINAIKHDLSVVPQILINNAGIGGPFHKAHEVSENEWDLIFNTNVKAAFLFCKNLLPSMKENKFGRIINISSIFGNIGGAHSSTYAASKHALVGYTKSLAVEWGQYNITCNLVSPGYVDTSMGAASNNHSHEDIINKIPSKRQASPDEIARLVLFLIKPENSYINGSDIIIDGGLLAGLK